MSTFCIACYNKDQEACGSDSYFPCDGRWSDRTCISKAIEHYKKIKKDYSGFNLCKGTILNCTIIKYIQL